MATVINTNLAALQAATDLNYTHQALGIDIQRLSSGLRVNTAADDAGSFGVIKGLESDIAVLGQAQNNVADGKNVLQIADGALSTIGAMLQRMKVLAKQSANSTYNTSSRSSMNIEYAALKAEIDRVSLSTQFNGLHLLTGGFATAAKPFYIHSGVHADSAADIITTNIASVSVAGMSGLSGSAVSTRASASALLDTLDAALTQVSRWRGQFGAMINRLTDASKNNDTMLQNTTASMSQMRDVDFAKQVADLTKNQILAQSGTAMLSQANQLPQSVVQLLG